MTNDQSFIEFYNKQIAAEEKMLQLGYQCLSMSKIDVPFPCGQFVMESHRKNKEQSLRDAIISCGYLPEQVIEDRINQKRFELRNLYFEPAGLHQYILVDKINKKSFLLMEDVPSTGFELGYTTYHNKQLPYNYQR